MRSILLVVLIAMSVWPGQPERSIRLAWEASPSPGAISYRLHYGEASRQYTVVLDTGQARTASVSGLKPGQLYYFAATAVNQAGKSSAFSNEVSSRAR
jgi:fibronectin type 3 domain-containing protein